MGDRAVRDRPVIHNMAEHWVVAVAGALNFTAGVVALVFGAQINDSVLAALALFIAGTGTALVGWSLATIVSLARIVSRLESKTEELEFRLERGDL